MKKIWLIQTGHRWQYNTTHTFCTVDKYTPRICDTYCILRQQCSRERVSALHYRYIACLFRNLGGIGCLQFETLHRQKVFPPYHRVQRLPLSLLSNGRVAHLQTASSQQRTKRSTHLHLVAVLGLYVLENVDAQFVALS